MQQYRKYFFSLEVFFFKFHIIKLLIILITFKNVQLFMVGEITFLTYSINNLNKCTLTLDIMEYIANIANTPETEENPASFFWGG